MYLNTKLNSILYKRKLEKKIAVNKCKIKKNKLGKKLKFNDLVFPSLKTITQAGGRLDLETSLYFRNVCKKNKISFYIMYGQSEGTARLAYLSPDNLFNKIENNVDFFSIDMNIVLSFLVEDFI